MADLYRDIYSKAYAFDFIDGVGRGYCFDSALGASRNWYHARTINSKTEARAILATNTSGAGISFNAYLYDTPRATAENLLFFSENIYAGITNGQGWNQYNCPTQALGQARYSEIPMPDGSTNGVKCLTAVHPNCGIYQPFKSTSIVERGKMYTVSVWACGDSGGGSYTTNPTMRISYYTNTGVYSVFSPDISLTPTPTRVSWTFIANEDGTQTAENVAFGNGSGSPAQAQLVFWGAQVVEGNVPGAYLATSTNWNKTTAANAAGSTTTTVGAASADHYNIVTASLGVPANSSQLFDIAPFTVSTNNLATATTPAISIYGLY